MQLFTVGLHKLSLDGTPVLGEDGFPLPAYDNDDITTFARVWTGFTIAGSWRSNTESNILGSNKNGNDPMKIKSAWRDRFPKTKLDSGYIGDKYPLCADMPPRPFLAKGATFHYLGECSAEGCSYDEGSHMFNPFQLEESSLLYEQLCQVNSGGTCAFPDEVVLDQQLICKGIECNVDYVQGIKIVKGGLTGWYEFIRPPCVRLAFTANNFWSKFSFEQTIPSYQCADPHMAVAAGLCCRQGGSIVDPVRYIPEFYTQYTNRPNEFQQEYILHSTLQKRCEANNWKVCEDHIISTGKIGSGREMHMWTNKPCRPQIQVHANGWINIVETPPEGGRTHTSFALNSPEKYRMRWEGGVYPNHKDGCGEGCTNAADETCLCDITVETLAAFTDPTRVPTVDELNTALFVGSVPPDTLDYRSCTSAICRANADVSVHFKVRNEGRAVEIWW
jgi:hypothetical protein